MKYSNYIYLMLFAVLLFTMSCTDLLQEDPETFYSESSVFSTESGVETAVNGLYASFGSGAYYGTAWTNFILPVSGKFFSTQAANRNSTGLNTNPNNKWLNDIWAQAYKTINVANIVIDNLENSTLDLNNKTAALGNAYFIRGKIYLDLVRLFNGVPIRLKPVSDQTTHAPKSTPEEVYAIVFSDLEKAKTMMPDASGAINGRPGKLAANVYLAKAYMTLAGMGDTGAWQKAKDELQTVLGAYSLTPTYAELFMLGNENTIESIFELQYDHTGGIRNSDIVRSFTPSKSTFAPSNVPTFGRIRPNKETFDDHFTHYSGDPRINATFVWNSYVKATGGIQKIYPEKKTGNQGFAVIAKWFDSSYNGVTTARNYIILRYADVLLMMAEVENELNGPDNAYQYVNEVLARARDVNGNGVSDSIQPADWIGLAQEDFRINIMKERRYELLSEGQTWFDTRRRGFQFLLDDVIEPHNNHPNLDSTKDFIYPLDEKNMLLPIPLSEISGNQMLSAEDQNPGY